MRILIVDGDSVSAAALQRLLMRAGHTVRRASSVAEALGVCASQSFELLVCETDLADGSGAALAREVAARCGARAIAVSTRDEDRPEAGDATTAAPDPDADAFDARLTKPFHFEDVLRIVAQLYPPPPAGAPSTN